MAQIWVDEVLDFWFAELTYEDWFGGSTGVDENIRTRFLGLYEQLKADPKVEEIDDARTALAAVIVFDQFPRNIFRGTAAAFATDDLALAITRRALDRELDSELDEKAKQFLYMPLMHSEISADQERCVDLFRALGAEGGLKYAIEHRDIVAQYGRFPHRNRVLERESTPEELDFLGRHAGYGQ